MSTESQIDLLLRAMLDAKSLDGLRRLLRCAPTNLTQSEWNVVLSTYEGRERALS